MYCYLGKQIKPWTDYKVVIYLYNLEWVIFKFHKTKGGRRN